MPQICDPEGIEVKYLYAAIEQFETRVLEIGCGDGRLTWQYVSSTLNVLGIDPNYEALNTAWGNCLSTLQAKVQFAQANAEALPLADETIGLAILARSL